MLIQDQSKIVFLGDSITDGDRFHSEYGPLGFGYVMMAASWFSALHPHISPCFINRGHNGHRIRDLKAILDESCIDINPNIVSILIGINDCWRRYSTNEPTLLADYASDFRDILVRIRKNTKASIIMMDPFVLPFPADRAQWREDIDLKIEIVHELAYEFDTIYIPLDAIFHNASSTGSYERWVSDGVHPTMAGHALIAMSWLKAVKAI